MREDTSSLRNALSSHVETSLPRAETVDAKCNVAAPKPDSPIPKIVRGKLPTRPHFRPRRSRQASGDMASLSSATSETCRVQYCTTQVPPPAQGLRAKAVQIRSFPRLRLASGPREDVRGTGRMRIGGIWAPVALPSMPIVSEGKRHCLSAASESLCGS